MGWLFEHERTSARRYAPDLRKDPVIRRIDSLFPVWVLLGLLLRAVAGLVVSGGSLFAAFTEFLCAGLVRVFLLHHATWSMNSICHMYGRRRFATNDQSRDNWTVALVSLGEGWHHSHHAFPTSAQHGLRRTQIDPSYAVIPVLERLGLVWNIKRPRAERIAGQAPPGERRLAGGLTDRPMPPLTAHALSLHGHRVTYRTAGRGPALLLLHGVTNSSQTWARVAPLLSRRFTLIAPDLLGNGESATPRGDYSLGAHASGVRDLLTALGHDRVSFIGHSFGGGLAMQFAYQFPERGERLVLVSSGGLGREVHFSCAQLRCPAPTTSCRS